MIVMKFGGSSVKDAHAVDRVCLIVSKRQHERPAVVVSAMGTTTDSLVRILECIEEGRLARVSEPLNSIRDSHMEATRLALDDGEARRCAMRSVDLLLAELDRYIDGMTCLSEVSPRSRDSVLALGEFLSATLMSHFLKNRGLPAVLLDPRELILTDDSHCAALPNLERTAEACRKSLLPLLEAERLPVTGGFVGGSPSGHTTTLGRGGSDLSASLIAGALEVERLEFWKDVDGILSADPRIVENAVPVSNISFREAAELAFLGAKVLHPASIQPAVSAGVPIRVLNSYRYDSKGTAICSEKERFKGERIRVVSAIACKRNQTLINVHSNRMLGATGFLRRVFEVFDRLEVSVDHIATSEVNVTVSLDSSEKARQLSDALGEIASTSIAMNRGIVSVVGERLSDTPGVAKRLFDALSGINLSLITYGGSGVNLSMAVDDECVPRAVRSLHEEFFEQPNSMKERGVRQ